MIWDVTLSSDIALSIAILILGIPLVVLPVPPRALSLDLVGHWPSWWPYLLNVLLLDIIYRCYPSQHEQTISAMSSQDILNWEAVIEFLKAVARSVVSGLIIFKAYLTSLQGVEAVFASSSYFGVV